MGNLSGYVQVGYLNMGAIATPLLHYARTGQMFDDKLLLEHGSNSLPQEQRNLYGQFRQSRDEFTARDLLAKLNDYLMGEAKALREQGGYLLDAKGKLLEYDFKRNGFPVQVEFSIKPKTVDQSFFCAGVHGMAPAPKRGFLTTCIGATNLGRESGFKFLPMQDQNLARMLRTKSNANELGFYVVAHVDGKYQVFKDYRYQFGNFFQTYYASGLQPTKAVEVLMVDRRNGDILAKLGAAQTVNPGDAGRPDNPSLGGPGAGTGGATGNSPTVGTAPGGSMPGSGVTGSPTGGASTAAATPGSESASSSNEAGAVIFGLPSDAATLRIDKLLALLSYGTYSDAEKVSNANKANQELTQKFERIEGDDARLTPLQQSELRKLAVEIQNRTQEAQTLQHLEDLKRDMTPTFEASRLSVRTTQTVHYEHYQLRDGRHVVAFRGTDNRDDMETDFRLAVNPESVAELARRFKTRAISGAVVGLGSHLPGADDPHTAGQPLAFKVADKIVADLIRSGVPASKLVLTGHSLGGGLAQYAGFKHHVQAVVTFNTAPLSTQLMADAGIKGGPGSTVVRHYIAMITRSDGVRTVDPVSQKAQGLGLPDLQALQVVGKQYIVQVCSGLGSQEYNAFASSIQGAIVKGTFAAMGMGHRGIKVGAKATGAAVGLENASTEKPSSAQAGADAGRGMAKGYSVFANCTRHPFLCGTAAAGGVAVGAVAKEKVPVYWEVFNAHRMRGLYESITANGSPSCLADGVDGEPMPDETTAVN